MLLENIFSYFTHSLADAAEAYGVLENKSGKIYDSDILVKQKDASIPVG